MPSDGETVTLYREFVATVAADLEWALKYVPRGVDKDEEEADLRRLRHALRGVSG